MVLVCQIGKLLRKVLSEFILSGAAGNYLGDFAVGSKRLSGGFSDDQIRGVSKFGVEYFGNQLGDQSGSAVNNTINKYLEKQK